MSPWLLAMDVDGTILTKDYTVPHDVREEIQRARASGVVAVLVTARAPRSVFHILDAVGEIDAVICYGGALTLTHEDGAWRPDETASGMQVSAAAVREVVLRCREAGVSLAAYGADHVHVDQLDPTLREEFANTGLTAIETDLLAMPEPALKLLAIGDERTMPVLEELRRAFGRQLACLYSHTNYLEIMHKDVSKGSALDRYRAALGIAREKVVAIGDSENDLSMFAVAAMPIAMGNAIDTVKQAARWVTETNANSGVAVALRRCADTLWSA
ncbi:MAG: Cof-type HAD-IIB family hydrolase [Mesorhizobium sp.]